MEIRRTTLQQWWEAGDTERSTVKRVLFRGWAVIKGVLTTLTGFGAAYHAWDWWRCKEENRKLQDFHGQVADPSKALHIRESLSAQRQPSAPVLSVEQRVAAFRALGEPQRLAYDHLLDLTRGGLDSATERQLLQVGQKPDVVAAAVELVLATLDAEHREKLRAAQGNLNETLHGMLSAEGWDHKRSNVQQTLNTWADLMKNDAQLELDLHALADELAAGWRLPAGAVSQDKSFAAFLQRHHEDMKELVQQLNDAQAKLKKCHEDDRTLVTTHAAAMKRYEEVL